MSHQNAFVVQVPTSRTKVVAVRSISNSEVIAHGEKFSTVARKAEMIDPLKTPVLLHVPEQGKTYIYYN